MIEPATGRWTINAEGGKKYVKFNGFLGRFKPELTKIPVTGPFVFTAVTNDTIIMGRNENYWNAKEVHFKTLVQHKFTTTENAVLLTKAGKLDMDGAPVTPEVTTQLGRQIPGMRTLLKPVANQYALAFNFEKYPMTIPEVRKAISMAIDRNILFDVKKPLGRPSDPYASGISLLAQEKGTYTDKAFMMTLARYDYDPAKATALLESIGWRKVGGKWTDKNGEPVKLELNSSGIIIEAEICRDLLADFGFEIQYVPVDGNVMWASMEQGKHMIYYGIVASSIFEFPDPWSSFNSVYYYPLGRMASAFAPAKQGDPYVIVDSAGVSHDVGKIIANIRAASTDQELRRLTHEMAKLTNELCPHANLFEEAEVLRIYDPRIRYILKGYDNKAKLVTYDNYSEIRSGFAWSIRVGRMYKVK
jgi:peptide/nickel transport system substrate-binding protein